MMGHILTPTITKEPRRDGDGDRSHRRVEGQPVRECRARSPRRSWRDAEYARPIRADRRRRGRPPSAVPGAACRSRRDVRFRAPDTTRSAGLKGVIEMPLSLVGSLSGGLVSDGSDAGLHLRQLINELEALTIEVAEAERWGHIYDDNTLQVARPRRRLNPSMPTSMTPTTRLEIGADPGAAGRSRRDVRIRPADNAQPRNLRRIRRCALPPAPSVSQSAGRAGRTDGPRCRTGGSLSSRWTRSGGRGRVGGTLRRSRWR